MTSRARFQNRSSWSRVSPTRSGPPVVVLPGLRGIQQEKADGVRAEALDGLAWEDDVTLRGGHLLAFQQAHPHDGDAFRPVVGVEQLRVVEEEERQVVADEVVGRTPDVDGVPVVPLLAQVQCALVGFVHALGAVEQRIEELPVHVVRRDLLEPVGDGVVRHVDGRVREGLDDEVPSQGSRVPRP